jgi:hypothetical protein
LVEKLEISAITREASSRHRSIELEWTEPTPTNYGKPTNSNTAPSTTPIQLPSPQATPEASSPTPSNTSLPTTPQSSELSYDDTDEEVDLPGQPPTPLAPGNPGNHATRRNEIYAGLNTENIIPGGRSRATHTTLATQYRPYNSYHSAFSTALRTKPVVRQHRDQMLLPLKSYREMLRYPFKDD